MSYCDGLIAQGLAVDCSTVSTAGYERKGVILNRSDIASVAFTGNTVAITLKDGKKGYVLAQRGSQPFSGSTRELNVGTYGTTFTKNVAFAVLSADPNDAAFVDTLANGEFVVVLELKDKGDGTKSPFVVFGLHNGLTLTAISHDPYGDAKAGSVVTLTETEAPMSAVYLGATAAAGKTAFDSLTA